MRTRSRWWLPAFAVLPLVGGTIFAQSTRATSPPKVDAIFNRFSPLTPGCAVGADVKGQAVVRAAYGSADLEHDVPITTNTIFEAGSVSKQFTAAAVVLLARAGKPSLDDE